MSLVIGSNIAALQAQRRLGETRDTLSQVFERLSSGQRINRASDDAAGLAIANSLSADARIANQGVRNINDAISLLNVADAATESLTEIVTRQKELAQQSANGSLSDEQRSALDEEYQALTNEYDRILASSKFNDLTVLSSDFEDFAVAAGGDTILTNVLEDGSVGIQTLQTGTESNIFDLNGTNTEEETDQYLFVGDFNDDGFTDLIALGLESGGKSSTYLVVNTFLGSANGLVVADQAEVALSGSGGAGDTFGSIVGEYNGGTNRFNLAGNTGRGVNSDGFFNIATDGTIGAFNSGATIISETSATTTVSGDFNGDGFTDSANTSFNVYVSEPVEVITSVTEDQNVSELVRSISSVDTESNALLAIDSLDQDLQDLADTRATIGASLSRIQTAREVVQQNSLELETAKDRILSADVAGEAAKLTLNQIKEQTATAVLAQANLQPQLILNLLADSAELFRRP